MKEMDANEKALKIEPVSLPKGGGAYQGVGGRVETDVFTGDTSFSIPVYTSPCRDYEPDLKLEYQASAGNGIFGMGFRLDLPLVERKTSAGIPRYIDEEDSFLLSGFGELTKASVTKEKDGCQVYTYLPATDKPQYRIEFIRPSSDTGSYWRVVSGDNQVYLYGTDHNSRITGPQGQTFAWLLKETTDCRGNAMNYCYEESGDSRYIHSIWYGNYIKGGEQAFSFEVRFSYECGEADGFTGREDSFTSCRGGVPLHTDRLCRTIRMIHHFGTEEMTVRRMRLTYDNDVVSLLVKAQEEAYGRLADGSPICRSVPPIELFYMKPSSENGHYEKLRLPDSDHAPGAYEPVYRFVDLYGEGIAGLLYSDRTVNLYYEPLGNASYAMPRVLEEFPADRDLQREEYRLTSLEGNGVYDLVVESENRSGYYQDQRGQWSEFIPFEAYPNNYAKGCREEADLQGDYLQHMAFVGKQRLVYYPGNGKKGTKQPVITQVPKGFPVKSDDPHHSEVVFLDILGDGLSHRVRVTNGTVEYWPNLGYGRFGERCTMENAPFFGGDFDAGRIFFADIDGTGAQDLAYAFSDHIEVYINQGGCRFLEPFSVSLPEGYTGLDHISFADVNGCGYTSLIFTKMGESCRTYVYDFHNSRKPYLLERINNHMGYIAEVEYSSCVQHYLEDKRRGIHWESIPPFPVFVAQHVRQLNVVTGYCTESSYHYQHGYYDTVFRNFCGFGFIEEERRESCPEQDYQGPVQLVRSWYYTGHTAAACRKEYFKGDPDARVLPKVRIHSSDGSSYMQAVLALKGKPARTERYELSGAAETMIPVTVEEFTYEVAEVLPAGTGRGAYRVRGRESIHYIYDSCTDDPRIRHVFLLDVDEYDNKVNQLTVCYPRRKRGIPEQESAGVLLEHKEFINDTDHKRVIGALASEKLFEIAGFTCTAAGIDFESAYVQTHEALTNIREYLAERETGLLNARTEQWSRSIYWNEDQSAALPEGRIGSAMLLHHMEHAVLPQNLPSVLAPLREEYLREDCGYILQMGCWWNRGLVRYYDTERFCLLLREENSFVEHRHALFRSSSYEYDPYALLPVRVSRWEDEEHRLVNRCRIDYHVMKPDLTEDENGCISEVKYDPLGMVVAASEYGYTDGLFEGSRPLEEFTLRTAVLADILERKQDFIQKAGRYYSYDLSAFDRCGQPVSMTELVNTVTWDGGSGGIPDRDQSGAHQREQSGIRSRIVYYDGLGMPVQEKQEEDGHFCLVRQVICNGQEKEVLEYAPVFCSGPEYEAPDRKRLHKTTFYDVCQRERLTRKAFADLADKTLGTICAETEYEPWEIRKYDENDTVMHSQYYMEFMKQYPAEPSQEDQERKEALDKAAAFYLTPDKEHLDCYGNKCRDYLDCARESYVTYLYNSLNKVVSMQSCEKGCPGHIDISAIYTMQGETLVYETGDSGKDITLKNLYDQPAHTWDARGNHLRYEYDALGRTLQLWNEEAGAILKNRYGPDQEEYREKNCVGRLIAVYDQAGIQTFEQYSVLGKPCRQSRTYLTEYEKAPDWSKECSIRTQERKYMEEFTYNLIGEPCSQLLPGGEKLHHTYNGRGLTSGLTLEAGDGSGGSAAVEYGPGGWRSRRIYGNGYSTEYRYHPVSMLLEQIRTTDASGKTVQNLWYVYDPAGNITRIRDDADGSRPGRQTATQGGYVYTYDERGQLKEASGREMPGNAGSGDYDKLETYLERYTYDGAGNLTQMLHRAPGTAWTRTMETADRSNRLVKADGRGMDYDAYGNLLHASNSHELIWNARNQLVRAVVIPREGEEADSEYYVYDGEGVRVRRITRRKTAAGIEVTDKRYIGLFEHKLISLEQGDTYLDRSTVQLRTQDGAFLTCYRWDKDDHGRENDGKKAARIHYILDNHLNSSVMEADEEGRIITAEEYYPFGGTAVSFGERYAVGLKEYRYCGKENDRFTGLYYYGYRYCFTVYGRMISADSMDYVRPEDNKTLNRYRYCNNNPIVFVDSDGHCPKRCLAVKKVKSNEEMFVRFVNEEEANISVSNKQLVPQRNPKYDDEHERRRNPEITQFHRKAKWISQIDKPRDPKTLGQPKNYTHQLTIIVSAGTKDWLNAASLSYEEMVDGETADENRSKVFVKSNEQGSYGIGFDLLPEFNRRIIKISASAL